MDRKTVLAALENLGFGIAHSRRVPRSQEIRFYVAVYNPAMRSVTELRWLPGNTFVSAYRQATRGSEFRTVDVFVQTINLGA